MAIRMSQNLKNQILVSSSVKQALDYGVIEVYSGSQPASASDSPTGNLLGRITAEGLAWTQGNLTGGLLFASIPAASMLVPYSTQSWILTVSLSGTAGWFRFRSNTSASISFDGAVTPPFDELFLGDTSLVLGQTRLIESFQLRF